MFRFTTIFTGFFNFYFNQNLGGNTLNQQHSKINPYTERLFKQVLENSESPDWASAVLEWEIHDWHQDSHNNTSCLCGKEKVY